VALVHNYSLKRTAAYRRLCYHAVTRQRPLSSSVRPHSALNAIEQLAEKTEAEFTFLCSQGLLRQERRILFPDSFKGGFVLTYAGNGMAVAVEYLDMQFEVRAGEVELFGPNVHPAFSGNMFSREHLLEHLSKLAAVLQAQFAQHVRRAV